MCMNTPPVEVQDCTWNIPVVRNDGVLPNTGTYPMSSSENSTTFHDDNHEIIEFGPLKIKQRKKPALTLATGRRSKYELLSPEDEHKRDVRRARNRAAAERVRISRLNIEQELQGQIDALEEQEQALVNNIEILQNEKLRLETRCSTHEKICPTMTGTYPQSNDLMSIFPNTHPPIFEQVNRVSDIDLHELFLDLPTPLENNYSNSLTSMIPDDIDDFLMNS